MSKNSLSKREHLIKFNLVSVFWINNRLSILLSRRKEPYRTQKGSVDEAFKIVKFEKRKELRTPQ